MVLFSHFRVLKLFYFLLQVYLYSAFHNINCIKAASQYQ